MKKRRSSSVSTDLQLSTPKKTRESSSSSPSPTMDLTIVPSFTLPDDWVVEYRKRTGGFLKGNVDRYYHEPGTGKKLRSLISVKKYLTEPGRYEITSGGDIRPIMHHIDAMPLSIGFPGAKHESKAGWGGYNRMHQIKIDRSKPFKLPDGWFIRRIPRLSGQSMGRVDKYYCERATGLVFRSKLGVQRYLAENYLEENTTLTELFKFKPAGLIQMSRSENKDADEENLMAIVPHFSNMNSYSSMSDDIPLKDLILKSTDVPAKDLVWKSNNVGLKDLVGKSDNVPLKDLVRNCEEVPLNDRNSDEVLLDDHARLSDDAPLDDYASMSDDVPRKDRIKETDNVPLKDYIHETDNVPLKDLVLKSSVAGKTSKNTNKLSQKKNDTLSATMTNTSSVDVSNQPTKIKWVLTGTGGDGWIPFIRDTKVAETHKQEWTEMFINIVSQKQLEASISDAQESRLAV